MSNMKDTNQNFALNEENETALAMSQKLQRRGSRAGVKEIDGSKKHIEKIAKLNKAFQIKQGFEFEKSLLERNIIPDNPIQVIPDEVIG